MQNNLSKLFFCQTVCSMFNDTEKIRHKVNVLEGHVFIDLFVCLFMYLFVSLCIYFLLIFYLCIYIFLIFIHFKYFIYFIHFIYLMKRILFV